MPKATYIHPLLDVEAAIKSLLEEADAPLLALSRSGDVLVLNWRMQAVTGFTATQALQDSFLEVTMEGSERRRVHDHLNALMKGVGEAPDTVQWTFIRRDGKRRSIAFNALLMRDSTGEPIGVLYVGLPASRASSPAMGDPLTTASLKDQDENITSLAFRIDVGTGRIVTVNPASTYLLGYAPEELTNDPKLMSARVLPEYHEAFQEALQDAVRGVARSIEVGFAKRDNNIVILAMMLYPGRNRERRVVSVEGIGRDITARKEMEQQLAISMEELQAAYDRLQAQHEELQSLDRLKSQVLANVSHELRTPLVTIRGYNELMLRGEMGALSDRMRKGLEISAKSIQRLLTLIENLIDFARLEKDRFRLPRESVDLGALLTEIVAESADAMRAKELKVALELPKSSAVVSGDRARLKQSFRNLMDNAEKFCEAGGTVTVSVERQEGHVATTISDTGIGIPEEEQEKIFDTFYQVDGSTTRPYPGLGIGLAIVREVVELHGGAVDVRSEVGAGSRFRVLLPEQTSAPQHAPAPNNDARSQRGSTQVDDDDDDDETAETAETIVRDAIVKTSSPPDTERGSAEIIGKVDLTQVPDPVDGDDSGSKG